MLFDYKAIETYNNMRIYSYFAKTLKLTPEQLKLLETELEADSDYEVFIAKRSKKKSNFLWRLSAPLYTILYILLVLFKPIMYICTGKFSYRNAYFKYFMHQWYSKL